MTTRPGLRAKTNEELSVLLRKEPAKAVGELYDLFSPALYGVAVRILGSEALAEDILQDSFVKVWQYRDQYDKKKGTLFTWILNITRRTAIDKTRSASFKRETRVSDVSDWDALNGNQQHWTPSVDTLGLRRIVGSLDEKQQEVIDLVYFKGYTHQEVQEALDIPLGTVKSRIRLAMKKLRGFFDDGSLYVWWCVIAQFGLQVAAASG